MSALDSHHPRVAPRFDGDAHNVLLLAPPMDDPADDGCVDLLTVEPASEEDVLFVTLIQSPDRRLASCGPAPGVPVPPGLSSSALVSAGDSTRSAAAATPVRTDDPVSVRAVSSPADLTDLGIELNACLTEWADDGDRTVVCFDSVTTLLQHVDLQRAFRFFHVVTGRVREVGGPAHYHLDPSTHDDRTTNTLKMLFDGVAEWDGEDWMVWNR